MKRVIVGLAIVVTTSAWIFLAPKAALTIRLVDQDGSPIPEMPVRLSTYSHTAPGAEWGQDVWEGTTKISDTNGIAAFVVRSKLDEVTYSVYPKPAGYYDDYGGEYCFEREASGRWLPWNPTVELVLKRIKDPVPMYVRRVGWRYFAKLPALEKPVGFDLMKSDWVKPYGEGEVPDFIFWLKVDHIPNPPGWDEKRDGVYHLYRTNFRLSFTNEGDGIQPFYVKLRTGSVLKSPPIAPADGYEPQYVRHSSRTSPTEVDRTPTPEDQNFLFRVRSEMSDGRVVRACYGKIYGNIEYSLEGGVQFLYYLNPDPTSRSLEFDTKRNLYTPKEEGETCTPGP